MCLSQLCELQDSGFLSAVDWSGSTVYCIAMYSLSHRYNIRLHRQRQYVLQLLVADVASIPTVDRSTGMPLEQDLDGF